MSVARPTVGELALKARSRLRARGAFEGLALATQRLAQELASSDRLIFFVRAAAGARVERGGVELRFATEADADRYAVDIGTDSPRTFRARLCRGTGCFVVVSAGRIVHSTWVTRCAAWTREIRRYVRPPAGEAYVYESFTRRDARGQGLYPLALRAICAELAERSVRRVWVGVENRNVASLRAVTKASFEEALTVDHRRLFGKVVVEAEPAPSEAARPFVELSRDAGGRSSAEQAGGAGEAGAP